MKRTLLLLPLLTLAAAAASPDGLLDADALVAMFDVPAEAKASADPRDLIDEIAALRNDGPARRDPDLRVARWLELAARAEALGFSDPLVPEENRGWSPRALAPVVRHLVSALPPPSRWPALREALDARAAASDPTNQPPALSALRLSLACLSDDAAASSNALEALLVAPGAPSAAAAEEDTKRLRKTVFRRGGPDSEAPSAGAVPDADAVAAVKFVRRLASAGSGGLEGSLLVSDADLALPDETLSLLFSARNVLYVAGSDAVRARFRALVRAGGAAASDAPVAWSFADTTPDGLAYFAERSAARNAPGAWEEDFIRFAEKGPDDGKREWSDDEEEWSDEPRLGKLLRERERVQLLPSEALAYLRAVVTLCARDLAAGRAAAAEARLDTALPAPIRPRAALLAVELANGKNGRPADTEIHRPADMSALADFIVRRALPPAAPVTLDAVELFVRVNPSADDASAARLAEATGRIEGDPEADAPVLLRLAEGRFKAALASGRFDEAFAAARREAEILSSMPSSERLKHPDLFFLPRAMLDAGETNRFDEALALMRSVPGLAERRGARTEDAEMLASAGRVAEAQALYAEAIVEEIRGSDGRERGLRNPDNWKIISHLRSLAKLYLDAGRPEDALALFERVPFWGVPDAAGFTGFGRGETLSLLARALDGAGRGDDAARVARFAVEVGVCHCVDWPWEILIERLPPDEFLALADRLHALDPWEERPVQWKAEALRRAGRLEEAEEAARLALRIDPTDGETAAGERIRSYAILASILEEKGGEDAAKEAATLRSVVAAVRLAEKGDELTEAGLVSLALDAYDRAAALFEDAYCVQWRLAERLRERGFPDLAAAHYEETFRRMPEQFGRVASLCFGCAGVFESSESLSAAERILPDLAARPGALPATHRLLGMLRAEQERYDEAWEAFRAALRADPGYLDAVNDLLDLHGKVDRPRADWEWVQRRAFELDPLGLRVDIDPEDILDWTAVREANAAARALLPDAPESVFPLPASAAALAAGPAPERSDAWEYQYVGWRRWGNTFADRAFDAALAFAARDNDPPTWLGDLCGWLNAAGNR